MKKIPIRHINTSQNKPGFSKSFRIREVGNLVGEKDMIQELHRHNFFYILALNKGAGNHEIDFTSYKVCDNSIFFMRPGQVHQLMLKSNSTGYLMEFEADFYHPHDKVSNQLIRKAAGINFLKFDSNQFKKIRTILSCLFKEYIDQQDGYQEVIKSNLGILLVELIRQNNTVPAPKVTLYSQERLEEFLEHLEKHVSRYKQASQYADMMNLSLYQLNSICKETLGKTSSEIINDYIILESKRYLMATSNQVNQISYHLGYEDVSYFIRFFKKHTRLSPEAFRQEFR